MASFVEDLWQSIFTPGPTPTLLVATNATFAALQIILACLLYATLSIHFLVLSVLSGGLWAAINWFARELKAHQQQEAAAAEAEERKKKKRASPPRLLSSDDSETEVEGTIGKPKTGLRKGGAAAAPAVAAAAVAVEVPTETPVAVSTEVEAAETHGELKHRVVEEELLSPSQGSRSAVSTEDEWEKVSENENEKDK